MKPFEPIEEELQQRNPGWWERIVEAIPELAELADTPQPLEYHAEGDVATHTRLTVEACPTDSDADLLWAGLLHDVGKPLVTREEDGKITAHGHHTVGAEMAERLLRRLQMAPERRELIVWAVQHHTFHLSWNLTGPEHASKRQRRFVADPRFPFLLELLRLDSIASRGHPRGMAVYELYRKLREKVAGQGG
jgi:putative nucleotidyltransferase with HDIG domain